MLLYTGEKRSLRSRVIKLPWWKILPACIFAAVLFAWSIGFTEKLVEYYRLTEEYQAVEMREEVLREEITRLREQKQYLQEDWYIERLARERLNLVKPGEVVIRFVDPD